MKILIQLTLIISVLSCVLPLPSPQTSSGGSKSSSSGGNSSSSSASSGSSSNSSGGKSDYPYDYGNYEDFGTGSKKASTVKPASSTTAAAGLPDLSPLFRIFSNLANPETMNTAARVLVLGLNFTSELMRRAMPAVQTAVSVARETLPVVQSAAQRTIPVVQSVVQQVTPLIMSAAEQVPKVVEQGSKTIKAIMEDTETRARIGEAITLGVNFTGEFGRRAVPLLQTTVQRAVPLVQTTVQQAPGVIKAAGEFQEQVRSAFSRVISEKPQLAGRAP